MLPILNPFLVLRFFIIFLFRFTVLLRFVLLYSSGKILYFI